MPTRYKDYPIYTYDEPASYNKFIGGINTDPSNEHLVEGELRDCVNMHYLSGALVKRNGAKKLCDISCDEDLTSIQGIFLFTYKITYIIIAADGKLYQGVFNENTTIKLNRLYIYRTTTNYNFEFNPEDAYAGLEEKQPSELIRNLKHDGYIQVEFRNKDTDERFNKNERGSYFDVLSGAIEIGDVFTEVSGLIEKKYLCINSFDKQYYYPNDPDKWVLVGDELTYTDFENNEITIDAEDVTTELLENLSAFHIYMFDIWRIEQWTTNDYCFYNGKFYRCIEPHYNRYNSIKDPNLFTDISNISNTKFEENKYLVFQNHRKVEGATFNNKLYIATGTRVVEVYMSEDNLRAKPVSPYLCNYTEIAKIGYNYMSPYPELAVASQKNTVTTSITGLKVMKTIGGRFLLEPIMNIQIGDSVDNYYFRWEKFVNGTWYVLIPFSAQKKIDGQQKYSTIEVDDADVFQYRVTFAKSFELENEVVKEFDINDDYYAGAFASVGAHVYKCVKSYESSKVAFPGNTFQTDGYPIYEVDGETTTGELTKYWEEVFDVEALPYMYEVIEPVEKDGVISNELVTKYDIVYDYKINKVDGEYFGSATSVLFNNDLDINDNFQLINSCTKILVDGQKILLYGDRYNSGQWFKTIINNPGYITDRGCLSFKTTKNEELIKVVPFQGNLIAFANSENVGGSIHIIKGNGDDYDDESGYYSPYQRSTINASISCDNAETVQICDNILVFKYFDRVYYINASDLSNDVVKVNPCNDRVRTTNQEVEIPWDDNDCISEVTDKYYALIWKEKYYQDNSGDLVLQHPGMRIKMYYKMSVEYPDGSYGMPWLRDESEIFNSKFIIYVKGKPIYLYHNVLITFGEEYYKDLTKDYECRIHFRGETLNYPNVFKLIEHIIVGFHRNQYNKVDLDVIIRNEAGHILLDSDSKRKSIGDLAALKVGMKINSDAIRLDSTIQDTKLINTVNMFPCLLADTKIIARTAGSFALSSVTYNYTSTDSPDQNPYDTYTSIIRPKEVK